MRVKAGVDPRHPSKVEIQPQAVSVRVPQERSLKGVAVQSIRRVELAAGRPVEVCVRATCRCS